MKNILVTGGTGYIGSHTAVELISEGYNVIIADDLSNSKIETLDSIKSISGSKPDFYQIDITELDKLEKIFKENTIDGIIHFAGFKAVGESVAKPLKYYYNNILSTINLCKLSIKYNVGKFVFSSSATVYGNNVSPLREDVKLSPTTNPYGETKAMCERILTDTAKANPGFNVTLLRYFNPVGAHESGLIGEAPNGIPNNLTPYITKVAKKELPYLSVFGDDYETPDGTGMRDYIHVVDLAKGHVMAYDKVKEGVNIYNLGTGKGTSVFELVNAFKKANNIEIPFKIGPRRPGDIAICYADTKKAEKELGFVCTKTIEDMCRDAWNFEKNYK